MTDVASPLPATGDGLPADLAAPAGDPWAQVQVPDGWDDVAALAREVDAQLEGLADAIMDTVRREVPGYAPPAAVPDEDLHGSVINNVRTLLLGLAEHRPPTAEELEARRELGTRRALQGLPIDAVLGAYSVGYREVWAALVARTPDDAPATTRKLLGAATTVWGSVQEISDAIAAAHATTSRRLEAKRIGARQRFVELLDSGRVTDREADRLARALGFDPAGRFQVTTLATTVDDLETVDLQRRADDLDGRHAVVARGNRLIVVAQEADRDALVAVAHELLPEATLASGARRAGLVGASASLADAELALDVTDPGAASSYDEVWLWAELTGAAERLAEPLAPGTATARSHPHLAAAVTAFADHGFSATDAARALELHANTVKYRLDRWEELTGWDPRGFAGLARSLTAIRLRR